MSRSPSLLLPNSWPGSVAFRAKFWDEGEQAAIQPEPERPGQSVPGNLHWPGSCIGDRQLTFAS
jgi:hypothetical protein